MTISDSIRTRAKALFLIAILAIFCAVLALILTSLHMFTPSEIFLTILVVAATVLIIYRQSAILDRLKPLDTKPWNFVEYEKGISHQFQLSAQQTVEQINTASQANADLIEKIVQEAESQIEDLETRVKALEDRKTLQETSIVSTHEHPEHAQTENEKTDTKTAPSSIDAPEKDTRLISALQKDTLQLHLQPIVELPSRSPKFFDTSMRLQLSKKKTMDPAEFETLANAWGLTPEIDIKMIFSTVRIIRALKDLDRQSKVFCSLSGAALAQEEAFNSIYKYLQVNEDIKEALVLEITQRDFETLNRTQIARFDKIADLGYQLALGHVENLEIPVESIAAYGFAYVKILMDTISQAADDHKQTRFSKIPIASALHEHKVSIIASHVTRESQAIELIDMGIPFGQGLLFSPPRPVKPELLGT